MKNKICILDDRKLIIQLITSTLEPNGYEVVGITEIEKALAFVKKEKPFLLFLNPTLFNDEGKISETRLIEFIKKVTIPFYLIPLMGFQAPFIDLATKIGAKGCLPLPFTPEEILKLTKNHADKL